MHLKADESFSPSTMAREEMHRILSTGSVESCGGEAMQMLAYLDGLTANEAAIAEAGMRSGPWERLSLIFRT